MPGLRYAVLRAPEGGDDGKGGGGGNAETFTEAQLAVIGQTVNSAITAHMKRSLPGAVAEGLKTLNIGETIAAEVAKLVPKPAASDDNTDDGKPKPKGNGKDSALELKITELATKLEQSEAKALAADKARIDAENTRKMDAALTTFRNTLQPKVREDLLDVAVGHFGRGIQLAEDGTPLMRIKRAPYKGAPEQDEDAPLTDAVAHLLGTDAMKPFLPAPGGNKGDEKRGNGAPLHQRLNGGAGNGGTDPASKTLAAFEKLGINPEDV